MAKLTTIVIVIYKQTQRGGNKKMLLPIENLLGMIGRFIGKTIIREFWKILGKTLLTKIWEFIILLHDKN